MILGLDPGSLKIGIVYASTCSKLKLADVRPIVGPDRLYFVERDIEEQTDYVCRFIELDNNVERVYKLAEHDIKLVQLCSSNA